MRPNRDWQIAKESMLLASVPDPLIETILSQSEIRSFARGTTIFLQGEPADNVYIVLEGWVKLYRISQSGAEAVVTNPSLRATTVAAKEAAAMTEGSSVTMGSR